MKPFSFLILWLFIQQACTSVKKEETALLGMYVRQFNNEFGYGWDTVVIEPQPGVADGFIVRHHTQTTRKSDGQVATPVRKELVLSSMWNRDAKVLIASRLGRRYTFPEKGIMMLGTARFEQIY